jgi:hypothetical protein
MTAISCDRPQKNPLALALICAAVTIAAIIYGMHAVERHGTYAEQVRKCLEQNGPALETRHPLTGRIARCAPLDGHFGIQILEPDGEHEVTSFKNKSTTLDQVKQYLRNAGFPIP